MRDFAIDQLVESFLVDICLLAKESSLLPIILNEKSQQSGGGGSHSKAKVWGSDLKKRLWVST